MKIHVLGPSGSGTTTVGKLLALQLNIPFFDSDDIFWEQTEIPYSVKRSMENRQSILLKMIKNNPSWVLSGSATKWGDILLKKSDLIILLYTEQDERIRRLKEREKKEFGERIKPGNDMYENHKGFLEWAMEYENGGPEMRSRTSLEAWVKLACCKVFHFDNRESEEIVKEVFKIIG